MDVWYIVLLSAIIEAVANEHPPANPPYLLEEVKATAESRVPERSAIIGAVANEHPPANPPYLLEEVKATAESRVLERVEHLLQSLSGTIKLLDDQIVGLLVSQNETIAMLKTTNKSFTERMMNVEQKIEPLPQLIRDTNEMIKTTNETFTQRLIHQEHQLERSLRRTGVYFMQPDPFNNRTFEVFRDWSASNTFGGDWIVFQRRIDGSVDFYRNWTEYKNGFGDLRGEHWLGLDNLHLIVKARRHELLIVLEDFDGVTKYAKYDDFKIGDESEKYIIKSLGKYTGTAGDSFTYHNGGLFSTYDQDNDIYGGDCSAIYRGAWWFFHCHYSHLNGEYLHGTTDVSYKGVHWNAFRGSFFSLKSSKMMVRPIA